LKLNFAKDDLIPRKCHAEEEKVADLLTDNIRWGDLRGDLNQDEAALVLWAEVPGLNVLLDKKGGSPP
jgi:hypothetical protein